MKRVLLYGVDGGVLIALLKLLEYQYVVRLYPREVYGGIVAVIFTVVGIWAGLRLRSPKEVVVVREVEVRTGGPFVLNLEKLRELATMSCADERDADRLGQHRHRQPLPVELRGRPAC